MLNKIGPAIDPYGAPDVISSKVLLILFTLTYCFVLFRYELM